MEDSDVQVCRLKDLDEFLVQLYGVVDAETYIRYTELINTFKKKYEKAPEFIGRAPGRVNLVGEHVDYMGYSVLPMAIKLDTLVAIGKAAENKVHVLNMSSSFPEEEFETDPAKLERKGHSWVNYVMAAYIGACQHIVKKTSTPSTGLNLLVEGQVPQGSGLSSSAALVCSAALAVLGLHGVDARPGDVAEFTAECEKFVGTQSGGMDQAISMMGELGKAKLVHFNPIRTEDVSLPEGAIFVIANSLAVSQKAVSADRQYNMRVVECRLATAVLALKLGLPIEQARGMQKLCEVEERLRGPKGGVEGALADIVRDKLDKPVYKIADLEELLGCELKKIFEDNKSQLKCVDVVRGDEAAELAGTWEGKSAAGFNLRDRALHVFSEAARVPAFKAVCDDASADPEEKLQKLARLMNESHESCRGLYECSCEELDKLVEVSREAGALGSRLTGAGWGGCTVSLVRKEHVEDFIAEVKQNYYLAWVNEGKLPKTLKDGIVVWVEDAEGGWRPTAGWENVIFASPPSSGGAILELQK